MSFRVQALYNRSNVNSFPMRSAAKLLLPLLLAPALLPGSAHAFILCTAPLSSCSGTENNVTFSNFSFSGYTPGPSDTIRLFGNPDGSGSVSLRFNPPRNTSTVGSFTYTATLTPVGPAAIRAFNNANAAIASSLSPGRTVTTTLTSSGLSPAASYSQTGTATATPVTGLFLQDLTSQTFTQTFNLNPALADDVFTVSHEWTARVVVPGPLPLLGAATAFGLSRKLRRRIRSAG